MNGVFSSRRLFVIAFLILFAANIIVLLGVYFNRSGEAESKLILTERELRTPFQLNKENSGFSLQILWKSIGRKYGMNEFSNPYSPIWLDNKKLEELGFDLNKLKSQDNIYEFPIPTTKEVFIVLEYDGDAFHETIKNAKKSLLEKEKIFKANLDDETLEKKYKVAKEAIKTKLKSETRLYAIDAGLSPNLLRKKYTDRTRYIITKGIVQSVYDFNTNDFWGRISKLSIHNIHVPIKYRKVIDSVIDWKQRTDGFLGVYNIYYTPRFEVELAYGKQYEPWIVSIKPMTEDTLELNP